MKKKDLEDSIVCFASYLDYCKTEREKNKRHAPSFENVYENFDALFKEVIRNNRVTYAAYRLSLAVDVAEKNEKEKEK